MPQWCDKHKMHTIDEDCPGCEREARKLSRWVRLLLIHPRDSMLEMLSDQEELEGLRSGLDDVKAGRVRSLADIRAELKGHG